MTVPRARPSSDKQCRSVVLTRCLDVVDEVGEQRLEDDSGFLAGATLWKGLHLLREKQRRKSWFCERR